MVVDSSPQLPPMPRDRRPRTMAETTPAGGRRVAPPMDEAELFARAVSLVGATVEDLAQALGFAIGGAAREAGDDRVHTKGKIGELVERALGANGGSSAVHDFPHLGIELKTIPVDAGGKPRESTFVAALSLDDADYAEWETSWVRAKLSRVLWIPVETVTAGASTTTDPSAAPSRTPSRTIGQPLLWSPSPEDEATLRSDFDEILGIIGLGAIETLTARTGTYLQVRPKAAHGGVRTRAIAAEDGYVETVPRGFYLRARFTEAILRTAKSAAVTH